MVVSREWWCHESGGIKKVVVSTILYKRKMGMKPVMVKIVTVLIVIVVEVVVVVIEFWC